MTRNSPWNLSILLILFCLLIFFRWEGTAWGWHRPIIDLLWVYPKSFHLEPLRVICTISWPKEACKLIRDWFLRNYVFFLRKLSFFSQKAITLFSEIYDFFLRKPITEQRIDANLCEDQLSCNLHDNYVLWGFICYNQF